MPLRAALAYRADRTRCFQLGQATATASSVRPSSSYVMCAPSAVGWLKITAQVTLRASFDAVPSEWHRVQSRVQPAGLLRTGAPLFGRARASRPAPVYAD